MGRILLFSIILLAIPGFSADYDIEDKVRMQDDPNYMEYFKKKSQKKVVDKASIKAHKKEREEARLAHEKARKEYVRSKPKDQSKEEAEYLKQKEKQESKLVSIEKTYAMEQHQQQLNRRILPNRLPASLMPPRIEKKKRKFK